ncbi:mug138 [Symbiodinium microadriaticum]|nr:mug138 [Symbiodinium microadriaticum]
MSLPCAWWMALVWAVPRIHGLRPSADHNISRADVCCCKEFGDNFEFHDVKQIYPYCQALKTFRSDRPFWYYPAAGGNLKAKCCWTSGWSCSSTGDHDNAGTEIPSEKHGESCPYQGPTGTPEGTVQVPDTWEEVKGNCCCKQGVLEGVCATWKNLRGVERPFWFYSHGFGKPGECCWAGDVTCLPTFGIFGSDGNGGDKVSGDARRERKCPSLIPHGTLKPAQPNDEYNKIMSAFRLKIAKLLVSKAISFAWGSADANEMLSENVIDTVDLSKKAADKASEALSDKEKAKRGPVKLTPAILGQGVFEPRPTSLCKEFRYCYDGPETSQTARTQKMWDATGYVTGEVWFNWIHVVPVPSQGYCLWVVRSPQRSLELKESTTQTSTQCPFGGFPLQKQGNIDPVGELRQEAQKFAGYFESEESAPGL